jgi:hypothetical protein
MFFKESENTVNISDKLFILTVTLATMRRLFIETSTHKDDAVINTYYLYKTRFLAGQ